MSAQSDWIADIASAADDLGLGIERLTPGEVVLSDRDVTVTVSSVLLSGSLLRQRLSAAPARTVAVWPFEGGERRSVTS